MPPPNTSNLSLSPIHPPKLLSPQTSSSLPLKTPQKIPSRPTFRTLTLNTQPTHQQAQKLRVKLWKTLSLKAFYQDDKSQDLDNPFQEGDFPLLSSPMLRKSLKPLKRLELHSPVKQKSVKRLLVQRFRLHKAVISLDIKTKNTRMINKSIHPCLQVLLMKAPSSLTHVYRWRNHIKIIGNFSRIKEFLYSYSFVNKIKNTHLKRIRLPALRKLTLQQKHSHGILHVDVLKSFSSLQELSLSTTYLNYKTSFQLQSLNLSTLKKLNLYIEGYPYGNTQLTFAPLIQCVNLTSLTLHLSGIQGQSLTNMINFPLLKKLSLKQTSLTSLCTSQPTTEPPPCLENLEKLILSSSYGPYDVNYYQRFLSQAKNLKQLALEFTLDELNILTKDPLPFSLESLSVNILTAFDSWSDSENLAGFIQGQRSLKNFSLVLNKNYSQVLDPLMKAIYSLGSLEKFKLDVGVSVQDLQAMDWNEFLMMIERLKSIELDMAFYKINSRDLSSLTQAMIRNRNLKELKYNVNVKGVSEVAFKEFVGFLEVMKGLEKFKVNIKGCPEESEEELSELLQEKVGFW